jgi:hypothetical protein
MWYGLSKWKNENEKEFTRIDPVKEIGRNDIDDAGYWNPF